MVQITFYKIVAALHGSTTKLQISTRFMSCLRNDCENQKYYLNTRKPWWSIKFVPPGHRQPKTKRRQRLGLLHNSSQLQLLVDIPLKSLIFPDYIAISDFRPDLIIISNINKLIILIALTCCCEENIEDWHREKLAKYKRLKELFKLCPSLSKSSMAWP